jgi:hypothetical protein
MNSVGRRIEQQKIAAMSILRKKEENFTLCTAIPNFVPRDLAIEVLHNHLEIITADPLISEYRITSAPKPSPSDPTATVSPHKNHEPVWYAHKDQETVWYEFTERVQYTPGKGKPSTGMIKYASSFTNTPVGLHTQTQAPTGVQIRVKYLVTETNPSSSTTFHNSFIGTENLFIVPGLHLRADIEMDGSLASAERVRTQCRAVIREVVDRMAHRAKSMALASRRRSMQLRVNTIDTIRPTGAGGRDSPCEISKRVSAQAPMLVEQQQQYPTGSRPTLQVSMPPMVSRRYSSLNATKSHIPLSATTPCSPPIEFPPRSKSSFDVRASWPRRSSTGMVISELPAGNLAPRSISTINTSSSESLNINSAVSSAHSPYSRGGSSNASSAVESPWTALSSPAEDSARRCIATALSSSPYSSDSDSGKARLATPSPNSAIPPSPVRAPPSPPISLTQAQANRMSLSKLITLTSPRLDADLSEREKFPVARPSIPKRPRTALDLAAFALAGQGSIKRRTGESVSRPRNVGRRMRAEAAAAAKAKAAAAAEEEKAQMKREKRYTFPAAPQKVASDVVGDEKEDLPPSLRIGRPSSVGMMAVGVNVDRLHWDTMRSGLAGLGITA